MGGVLACTRCGGEIRRGHTEDGPGNFYCVACGLVYAVAVDNEGNESPGDMIGSMTGGAFTGDKCPTCGRPWNDEGHNPAAGEVPKLDSAVSGDGFIEGPPPEEGREVLASDSSANAIPGGGVDGEVPVKRGRGGRARATS